MFEGSSVTLSGADDVFLNNTQNGQTIQYNSATAKWNNTTPSSGGSPTYANLPAGTTITVTKSGSSWPARPTSRADIIVQWKGPDPSPSIISSGTSGMLDNVDIRFVTP